jgi:pimeloyl-ACP methyl ester carboxylesterase
MNVVWKRNLRRALWRVGRVLLAVYLGIILVFAVLQTWLIFPGQSTQKAVDACITRTPPGVELLSLPTADGRTVAAVFAPALDADGRADPDPSRRPTVIYFYGNASCLNYSWTEISFFRKLGCNVLVPEFVGYGMSPGSPSESAHYLTADAAWDYLRTRGDVDPKRIVAAGWSLGAAAAVDLASRRPEVAGLITLSAFTSMLDMAHNAYPWVPSRLILKHHFENERKMGRVNCPALVVHGRLDSIVPARMAERLAAAPPRRADVVYLETAGHNDVFDADSEVLKETVAAFLDRTARSQPPAR